MALRLSSHLVEFAHRKSHMKRKHLIGIVVSVTLLGAAGLTSAGFLIVRHTKMPSAAIAQTIPTGATSLISPDPNFLELE